ncbi:MAG: sodium:proton antiporter [DPANN group archaeon]|nr:sodium:proton antiporter [DPANN group archaeon]
MIVISYYAAVIFMALGIYAVVSKENLIKKIIGLNIFTMGIHLFLIIIGFKENGIAPIITALNSNYFVISSVDPLPQALVLTSIVIDLSVTALALITATLVYDKFKTIDTNKINKLEG